MKDEDVDLAAEFKLIHAWVSDAIMFRRSGAVIFREPLERYIKYFGRFQSNDEMQTVQSLEEILASMKESDLEGLVEGFVKMLTELAQYSDYPVPLRKRCKYLLFAYPGLKPTVSRYVDERDKVTFRLIT